MNKYNRFEDFMASVISEADSKCKKRYNVNLENLYKVSNHNIISSIFMLIDKGWYVFAAVVALLILGPIAFGVSLVTFLLTPIGIIVAATLAGGGAYALKILYNDRQLPIAIKETGSRYKSDFENHLNEIVHIDNLIDDASDYLINKAKDF